MKKFKQLTAVLLAFLIILLQTTPAYAYYTYKYGGFCNVYSEKGSGSDSNFVYQIVDKDEKTAIITYVKNKSYEGKELVIPKEINGYKIIGLASFFDEAIVKGGNAETVKSIVIDADLVGSINYDTKYNDWETYDWDDGYTGLFTNFTNLESVVLPNTLTRIDTGAFYGCKNLKSVNMPKKLARIGVYAFAYCTSLEKPEFPSSLVNIERLAFYGCESFKGKIYLSKKLSQLGDGAFSNCKNVDGFRVADGNKYFYQKVGVLYSADKKKLLCYSAGKKNEKFTVPSTVNYISAYAFAGNQNIRQVKLPKKIVSIWEYCFYNTGLESLTLPKKVTTIYDHAFENCKNLKELNFNSELKMIKQYAFASCRYIKSVKLGKNFSDVDTRAFVDCKRFKKYEVEKGNKKLSTKSGVLFNKDKTKLISFPSGKKLESYVVPDTVISVQNHAFEGVKYLKEVKLPAKLEKLGTGSFYASSVEKVNIPPLIKYIEKYTFAKSAIKKVTFDKRKGASSFYESYGTTGFMVKDFAFYGCKNLTSIKFPEQLYEIYMTSFYECDNLTSLTITAQWTVIDDRNYVEHSKDFGITSVDSLVICGQKDSNIQRFAESNNIKFKAL